MDKKILKIYQLADGYCYNSDSLFLYDFARSFLKQTHFILDVGSGSGVVGLLCAKESGCKLMMIELDMLVVFLSKLNAKSAGIQADVIQGDFLDFTSKVKFDVILSNPPFYRSGAVSAKNHRIKVARSEESLPFDKLCMQVKRFLKPQGSFVFCYDAKESHRVFYTLRAVGLNAEVIRFVYPRLDKEASLILCQARINTKSSLRVLPPLITHNSSIQTDNTQEVKDIYTRTNTYSIKVFSDDVDMDFLKEKQ
ncbi:methyltransferase [Helicobacter sp. 13S00477-4]|uniref:tRNA1(Val) (adenine(37)-N6)-methyltransferase n=1 Tax=Helicobacter sp. 13S00477-4 TaxID=1905759 RepID=UPI000BA6D387|nr:methyltransferase [Helicobacter sp. 13S00477-4]PAF52287.1 hypothetical protein BKH44_02980 [Helicobacter sp. 13S00477-4]